MPRGNWDWGVNPAGVTVSPEISSSELAVRLGSISRMDRLGNVIFYESFEQGLGRVVTFWNDDTAGVALSADYARTGAYSVRVLTSANNDQWSGVQAWAGLADISISGAEASFKTPPWRYAIDLWLYIYGPTASYAGAVRYSKTDSRLLSVYTQHGWIAVATPFGLLDNTGTFSTIKLVLDPIKGKYRRVIINGYTYDISQYEPYPVGVGAYAGALLEAAVSTQESAQIGVYIDDLIITSNEP